MNKKSAGKLGVGVYSDNIIKVIEAVHATKMLCVVRFELLKIIIGKAYSTANAKRVELPSMLPMPIITNAYSPFGRGLSTTIS